MTMGERIAAKRKQKGFTQEYLAEKLGISRQSVSKWKKNVTKPDTANLMRLCDLLDTDAGYLLIGEEEKTQPQNRRSAGTLPVVRVGMPPLCSINTVTSLWKSLFRATGTRKRL